jgi:hypothetical protein
MPLSGTVGAPPRVKKKIHLGSEIFGNVFSHFEKKLLCEATSKPHRIISFPPSAHLTKSNAVSHASVFIIADKARARGKIYSGVSV